MSGEPTVSVVINNYNYGRFLAEAVESALVQTYPNTEVLVVDDGSTDESRSVLAQYDGRVTAILKENGGQASACNAGFDASRGEIVCFLDADDTLFPDAMANAVLRFDARDVAKVHWPLAVTDRKGRQTGQIVPGADLAEGDLQTEVIQEGPLRYVTAPTSGNAWSRHYLQRVYPVHEWGNKHGADAYLSMLAPLYGRVRRVCRPQGTYRVHEQNFSGRLRPTKRSPELFDAHCRVLEARLRQMGRSCDPETWKLKHYAWERGVASAAAKVAAVVPPDRRFVLVDDNQLAGAFRTGRASVPFLERDGEYWGAPPDDDTAIRELKRLRHAGCDFLVLAWPAFWWVQHYTRFFQHVRRTHRCVLENDQVVVFSLGADPAEQFPATPEVIK